MRHESRLEGRNEKGVSLVRRLTHVLLLPHRVVCGVRQVDRVGL
jgi:hypothetical protein